MQEEGGHWPAVKNVGTPTRSFRFGDYVATVCTEVVAAGEIEYLYLMPVFRVSDQKLSLCVASEKNRMYGKSFSGDGTMDMGKSHFLGVEEPAVEQRPRKPWWRFW